jgi:hypothetical protein
MSFILPETDKFFDSDLENNHLNFNLPVNNGKSLYNFKLFGIE